MFEYFMALARRVGAGILDGKRIGPLDRALYRLGRILVYGPLKNVLGLSRVLPPRFRFFEAEAGHGYSTALRLAVVAALSAAVAVWASLDPGRPVRGLATLKRRR